MDGQYTSCGFVVMCSSPIDSSHFGSSHLVSKYMFVFKHQLFGRGSYIKKALGKTCENKNDIKEKRL
jgi:hypothetical protein